MKIYYVYILICADGSYYVGVTNNIEGRLWEHKIGYNALCYTFKRRPVQLMYVEDFDDINRAIDREKQIKGWTRAKKEVLISDNENLLVKLSQRRKLNR